MTLWNAQPPSPDRAEIARLDGELVAARAELELLRAAAPIVLVAWALACDEADIEQLRAAVSDYIISHNQNDKARGAWLAALGVVVRR